MQNYDRINSSSVIFNLCINLHNKIELFIQFVLFTQSDYPKLKTDIKIVKECNKF